MKLINMTDYVLEQSKRYFDGHIVLSQYEELTRSYANFIKQPLALWMFVPCDEDGNVLEEPDQNDTKYDYYVSDWEVDLDFQRFYADVEYYHRMKQRVLFDGFEMHEVFTGVNEKTKTISLGGLINVFWFDTITQTWNPSIGIKNIEGLVNYGLTLTETALKTL